MIVLSVRFVFYYLQISFHTLLTYISLQVICATDNGVNIYTTTTFSNTFNTLLAIFINVLHKVMPSKNLIYEGICLLQYYITNNINTTVSITKATIIDILIIFTKGLDISSKISGKFAKASTKVTASNILNTISLNIYNHSFVSIISSKINNYKGQKTIEKLNNCLNNIQH